MAGLCSSYLGFGREPDLQRRRRFDAGALARSYASIYRSSDPQHHPYQATAPRTTWPSSRHYDHDQSYGRYTTTNGTKPFTPREELESPERHEPTTGPQQDAEPEMPLVEGPPVEPQRPKSEREAAQIGSAGKLTKTSTLAKSYSPHPVCQSETGRPPPAAAPPYQAQQLITQDKNALSRRVALKSPHHRPTVPKTEYHKQFSWKKPVSPTPIQVAEQSLYTGVRSAVPFQQNPVSMETEYQCSYQYIEPPAGPRLRKHVEQPAPIFHTYRKTKKKEKKLGPSGDGPSSPSPPKPEPRTEYEANYYLPERGGTTSGYIPQASDLRQQAWSYRLRAWGENFSRQHLGQLHSQNTIHWEDNDDDYPPTQYLTVEPCQQREGHRMPSVEPLDLPSDSAYSSKRSSAHATGGPPAEIPQAWEPEKRGQEVVEVEEENTDEREGRLHAPLMTTRTSHRTHHDLTTPVTGGAMLVRKLPISSTAAEASARRKEAWSNNPHYPPPADHRSICKPARVRYTPPSQELRPPVHGIQGMLRKPDFLHNGDHGVRQCQFMRKAGECEEDEHFSRMSWCSAASCSAASAILERAQKRREDFWGKR
ncbi:nuclear protein MDM1 isoform X2 [Cynoglossus semilaevis]|nr:nuclear protein MDM1 isoform X2 [Cynoglossus semilaevis]